MFYLILTMFIGMAAGFLMRRVKALAHIGKAISITIYVMLFFLGVKIGQDENILANLSSLGMQAMLLALAGATGSILFAALLYKSVFRAYDEADASIIPGSSIAPGSSGKERGLKAGKEDSLNAGKKEGRKTEKEDSLNAGKEGCIPSGISENNGSKQLKK